MVAAWLGLSVGGFQAVDHWACLLAMAGLAGMGWQMRRRATHQRIERMRERRLREELEGYARLDVRTGAGDPVAQARALAKRVCRTIADLSAFPKVAMLLRDAEGRMYCASSAGVDDLTVRALLAWGESAVEEERGARLRTKTGMKGGAKKHPKSFSIQLGEWTKFDPEVAAWALSGKKERRRWRRGMVAPIRMHDGHLLGAMVVCSDGSRADRNDGGYAQRLEVAIGPIELLAGRLAMSMESRLMSERLLRAEKLAGLGQLAGGVAHALNNPLTAVLGFAELIAESSHEESVRKDADTIRTEALRMRDTVQRLTEFWRPPVVVNEAVEMVTILDELGAACRATLEQRGVELVITSDEGMPAVRGSGERLKQVMEHLLNNAAQAIEDAGEREDGHAIRITLSHDETSVNVIVSDTGTGFQEPGRVFDPFYTTREPGDGDGMGLSMCYGIVREHGGEISAFNLHPHGAAVVVELPVSTVVSGESLPEMEHARVA